MRLVIDRPAALGNYRHGRRAAIDRIVIHTMEGTYDGTASWFANQEAHDSAHFGISVDGNIARYVRECDTAWHAGNPDINARSIGIELEGHYDDKHAFTPKMMDALNELVDDLCGRFSGIKPDRQHIIGHCEVSDPRHAGQLGGVHGHKDPGPHFPWNALMLAIGKQAA